MKLAVLIDADNASPRIADELFKEIASIGEASVRRIYGDFSGTRLKAWADILSTHAIMPHQNFANTVGKNASDIALVIDAMDLLHSGRLDAFCLVSSDSDFTRLAARIREHGVDVFGFGEQKTPETFVKACKRFIYTENLLPNPSPQLPKGGQSSSPPPVANKINRPPKTAVPLINAALSNMEDQNGWYPLSKVTNHLLALMPEFDPRTYGCAKMVLLIEQTNCFDINREKPTVSIRPKTHPA